MMAMRADRCLTIQAHAYHGLHHEHHRPHPASSAADYTQGAAYVGGRYVPIGEASIPITDWGFLRSDATYDVVTVWDGAFFRLAEHLQRFRASCARFRLDPG
jgi:branched-chain amino acid aminotransferase